MASGTVTASSQLSEQYGGTDWNYCYLYEPYNMILQSSASSNKGEASSRVDVGNPCMVG